MKIFFLKNKAFTLVELLISISIIAIISTAIIVSVNTSREKGRDVKKVNDITQIQIALENYKKIEGTYPDSLTAGEALIGSSSDIVFLEKVPDVSYSSNTCPNDSYSYSYDEDNKTYGLLFCLEGNIENYTSGIKCLLPEGIKSGSCQALALSDSDLDNGETGVAYGPYTFSASGGLAPYSFSVSSGTLPTGLSLDSSGSISGTPTLSGNYSFTVEVTDSLSSISSAQFNITIIFGVCGGIFVDSRDSNQYPTVQVGTQCWMAKNMNIGTKITASKNAQTNNSIIEKFCYGNSDSNCNIYGGLYQFNEFRQYSTAPQGICPSGWHIPSSNEWTILINYLSGANVAGGKMKATGTTFWNSPNTGATNSSGFTALGGGGWAYSFGGDIKNNTYFWSSSVRTTYDAWGIRLNASDAKVVNPNAFDIQDGLSVRCLKDS